VVKPLDYIVIGIFIGFAFGVVITWYFKDLEVRKTKDSAGRMRRDLAQAERIRQASRLGDEPTFIKPEGMKVMPDGYWPCLTPKERKFYGSGPEPDTER
jgi:hypothetical protein